MTAATHVSPQNIEVEESVLGAMLVAEPALTRVIDEVKLNAADFYLDRHRAIFECVHDLYAASKPVDELTVADALSTPQRKLVEARGGKARDIVSELAAKVPAAGNAKHYAEIVQRDALLRKVIEDAQRAIEAAHGGTLNGEVEQLTTALSAASGLRTGEIETVQGSDIRLRAVKFLDAAEMIPTRSITVGFGPAGFGKTTWMTDIAAAVTRGRMAGLDRPRSVLISSQEDDPEAVLAPRLVAAKADMGLVHFVRGLSLPSQVPALAARARTVEAAFVAIDPIAAHLDPSIDSHRDAATRAALAPLAEMATDLDLAVLVVAHPNKGGANGLDRISGSGAFGNAARSVVVFGADPGDPGGETGNRRIIAHLKCNVGKRAPSIAASIETTQVETEDGPTTVPRLVITGISEHSADDVLASPTGEERTERDEAREFLTEQLASGPVRSTELKNTAEKACGFTWRTAERAKRDLGIKAVQGPDGWYWLPVGQDTLEGSR